VQKRFLLRLSPELYAQLERWAAEELRSVNGQIEFALRQAVEARRKARPARGKADAPESGAKSHG
jgi:hypothetical protein